MQKYSMMSEMKDLDNLQTANITYHRSEKKYIALDLGEGIDVQNKGVNDSFDKECYNEYKGLSINAKKFNITHMEMKKPKRNISPDE